LAQDVAAVDDDDVGGHAEYLEGGVDFRVQPGGGDAERHAALMEPSKQLPRARQGPRSGSNSR
jgi:hypothetical protein